MENQLLRSKFLGSLVGTAVGDAMGASWEGMRLAHEIEVETLTEGTGPLIYTDDTHMTIGMAQSLVECRGFDGEHMSQTFIRNYDAEPWRGYGPGPPRVFRLIKQGESWDKAAASLYHGGSFGNGSAMRVAPVGLLYRNDAAWLREIAYQSSLITHAHELGKEGAALQAYAVALATKASPSRELDQASFLAKLKAFVLNEVYQEKLSWIEQLLVESNRRQVAAVLGNGIEAFNSVPTAIFSFLAHPESFTDSIGYAISLGGDTDTIAAMTGAIAGAWLGLEAIPKGWRERLENGAYIEVLAEQLWRLAVEGKA